MNALEDRLIEAMRTNWIDPCTEWVVPQFHGLCINIPAFMVIVPSLALVLLVLFCASKADSAMAPVLLKTGPGAADGKGGEAESVRTQAKASRENTTSNMWEGAAAGGKKEEGKAAASGKGKRKSKKED
jgi:hypothetical protein